jgi:hypothetical protein
VERLDLSVSSDSLQPADRDIRSDVPAARSSNSVLSREASWRTDPSAALRAQNSSETLTLAERTVRWEDDVSLAELQLFSSLYAEVVRKAQQELAGTGQEALPLQAAPTVEDSPRDALLKLRYAACELVRCSHRARQRSRPAMKLPRLRYLASALVALMLLVALAQRDALTDWLDIGNVSQGKTWLASSTYAQDAALSGSLGDFSAPFFFHTAYEASPWVEIDLGAETPVRSVTVVNRQDCCANRAVPLVIETSLDHAQWRTAATRHRNFARWRARLHGENARWLRLRVQRESNLHLKAVVVRK